MYHNILVPIAYEPGFEAGREIAIAKALAAPGARVTLLHVMERVPFYAIDYMPDGWREELVAAIKADMSAQSADVPGAGVAVVEGNAGRAILDWVDAEGADCIVLASHRTDSSLFGSTASWVARHAPCAVHLIR
ncbi:MAG: universal stress protein [Rhodobacteraceae bacterium]|jgi:nucleotide-binding universal stress UspA family protein|nr:universal stress protein [Paracoccaceae bacterium]